MALVRMRTLMAIVASVSAHLVFASAALANDCTRFAEHRDSYLYRTSAGMEQALAQMAQQRGVPVEAAAFYWGGDLMRANDPASLRSLALLTLASYGWRNNADRAETAMARIFNERGHAFAAQAHLLARLGALGDFHTAAPTVNCGDFDVAAHCCRGH